MVKLNCAALPATLIESELFGHTNRDLKEAVAGGRFREDLYYRLNVFPIALPALRQRRDDIPLLVRHFIDKHGKKPGRAVTGVPVKAMDALCAYGWPGNIRELENVIERALILSSGATLALDDLVDLHPAAPADAPAARPTGLTLEEAERHHISAMLEETCWQIEGRDGAAARLDINASTLRSRMRRLGIERPRAAGAAGVRRT